MNRFWIMTVIIRIDVSMRLLASSFIKVYVNHQKEFSQWNIFWITSNVFHFYTLRGVSLNSHFLQCFWYFLSYIISLILLNRGTSIPLKSVKLFFKIWMVCRRRVQYRSENNAWRSLGCLYLNFDIPQVGE